MLGGSGNVVILQPDSSQSLNNNYAITKNEVLQSFDSLTFIIFHYFTEEIIGLKDFPLERNLK